VRLGASNMTKLKLQQEVEGQITRLSKKGHGCLTLPSDPSKKIEIPFAIPGDVVKASIFQKKKGIKVGRLVDIISPSINREKPRCIHFGQCGGCRLQQMSYAEQLNIKQKEIEHLFSAFLPTDVIVLPIVPCDSPWHYRNKMEYTFSSDLAGNRYLGLIMDSSRGKVLNLTECHLVNPWFSESLKVVRQWWEESNLLAYHPHFNKGSLRTLTVREGMRSGDRCLMLTVSGNPEDALSKQHLKTFVEKVSSALTPQGQGSTLSIMLRIQQAIKGQATQFFEMVLHGPDCIKEILNVQSQRFEFYLSPSAFFQPNTAQAEKLYSIALQSLNMSKGCVIYDLYCGTGTLGICAAKDAKVVVGIEISPESSLDARVNAKHNGLSNVHILTGNVSDVIEGIKKNGTYPLPDVVMVDPPRSGLDAAALEQIKLLGAPKLLYISCNPTSQAENMKELIAFGYKIEKVQPVDQFPHTVHVENIVVLNKEGSK